MQRFMMYSNMHEFADENDLWDHGWPELSYAHEGDAGMDLCSMESYEIEPGCQATIGTGVVVEVPQGCAALVLPRSGLARDHQIMVTNSPGLIDSSYRGEIGVILYNAGRETFHVRPGNRIAQLVVIPFVRCKLRQVSYSDFVDVATETDRGTDGFGSTGV